MNFTSISGVGLILLVVYFGAIAELPDQKAILNTPSIVLVLGGTFAAFLISFPMASAKRIIKLVTRGILRSPKKDRIKLVEELVQLAQMVKKSPALVGEMPVSHSFLREGLSLAMDKTLGHDDFEFVIRQRAHGFKKENSKDSQFLITLAKFPPAFGLLGSVTGIIAMLMNLGKAGKEVIGQGMAIALLTTFWGVAVTNMFILPLADFAQRFNKEDEEMRNLMVEGLIMIRHQESITTMVRKLRSLLVLEERQELSRLQRDVIDAEMAAQPTEISLKHGS